MHAAIRTRAGLGVNDHLPLRFDLKAPYVEMRQRSVFDYQGMVWSAQKQDEKCQHFEAAMREAHDRIRGSIEVDEDSGAAMHYEYMWQMEEVMQETAKQIWPWKPKSMRKMLLTEAEER